MSLNNEPNFKSINLFTATCIVVANMIGTGVFTSLGFQVVDIKSGFVILFLWLVGGIFALCGALAYGELGAAMPRNGGEYYYLSRIYHPVIGFLSGWVSVTVGFAAPIAVAAMSLGQYFTAVFPLFSPTAIALLVVIAVSLIHTRNLQFGSSFQYMFTLLKVLLILVLVFCGFYLAEPQKLGFLPSTTDVSAIFSSPFAVSLVYVIYSYSGWNAAVYLANEVEKPEKNVPRALITGTLIVMGLYLLLNLMFLYTTPLEQLAGKLEVGYIAANYIFGANGAKIIGLLISVGLISSISSMVLAGSRVSQVIGEDIGYIKYERGDIEEAIQEWQRAVEVDSDLTGAQLALAVVLHSKGEQQKALNMAQATLRLDKYLADVEVLKQNLWGTKLIAEGEKLLSHPQIQALGVKK
ncbi:amino acid permease [Aetokthonos hydrillicola]|uniref:amino acid permease n=1 Tax=Aetokthonos hydrillicola TaxID=1550245 RepID=UPI001ABA8FA5